MATPSAVRCRVQQGTSTRMHLKLDTSGSIDDGDVARDLGQEPADIVVLSAADSDLSAFGAAYASLAGRLSRACG